jgi:S-adenosylmethionine:diacylglycerol 3-amino-3-carboxypropyl transferase
LTADIVHRGEQSATTPWRAGRLDARRGRQKLLFGRVYEDSAIERSAFPPGGKVFCIASAGCTALSLCSDHEVVACDVNPAQIDYVKRRLAGGGRERGSADKLMNLLRRLMPLAGWSRRKVDAFLALDEPEAQVSFLRNRLDTWRFRAGLKIVLSPLWLRGVYSPGLLAVLPPSFDAVLRRRMERCFALHPNRTNSYAHALLLGDDVNTGEAATLGAASPRVELVADDAASYLERCTASTFDGFSLSNILDGAGDAYRQRLFAAIRRVAKPGASVVLRSFGEPPPNLSTNHAERDRSMLWGIVDVRPVEAL